MEISAKNPIIIAVTSQNYRTITKHAGLCRKLLVYNVCCSEEIKNPVEIEEIERISVSKEEALHTCKPEVGHPVDVADVVICGSCGEGFIRKMTKRGIVVSVARSADPVEAIEDFLAGGACHDTCDGPHQIEIKRHPNCPHNKKEHGQCKDGHKHEDGHCSCGCGEKGDGECSGHGDGSGRKGGCGKGHGGRCRSGSAAL